jgi:hypothetical protein
VRWLSVIAYIGIERPERLTETGARLQSNEESRVAADRGWTKRLRYVSELSQRNARAVVAIDQQRPNGVEAVTAIVAKAHDQVEASLPDPDLRLLLAHETDPRSPERGQYAFVQALIREVAYNTLAKKDRKVRHLAAARFFETLETDELASALAGHYLAARDNATEGPEADASPGRPGSPCAPRPTGPPASAHDQATLRAGADRDDRSRRAG